MNPLKSKHYPGIMYLALIVVSLLLLFNIVSILDDANNKLMHKSLTGFAIENNEINQSSNNTIIKNNVVEKQEQEIYTSRPYIVFYIFLIGILIAITITFIVLSSTIKKNIQKEENQRKFG